MIVGRRRQQATDGGCLTLAGVHRCAAHHRHTDRVVAHGDGGAAQRGEGAAGLVERKGREAPVPRAVELIDGVHDVQGRVQALP